MDDISTEWMVAAQMRLAQMEGVPFVVLRRGSMPSSTIILRVNLLNGSSRVLLQSRLDDERVWMPAGGRDPMPDIDADDAMRREAQFDPDAWLLEIEDKAGRIWFPGKVVT
ncbi:MAG: DUF1491 family protein [Alphaproteobacteria bacterium]|nr:DUF1491 family protein [Alphaproteobacteria bacterium]